MAILSPQRKAINKLKRDIRTNRELLSRGTLNDDFMKNLIKQDENQLQLLEKQHATN